MYERVPEAEVPQVIHAPWAFVATLQRGGAGDMSRVNGGERDP